MKLVKLIFCISTLKINWSIYLFSQIENFGVKMKRVQTILIVGLILSIVMIGNVLQAADTLSTSSGLKYLILHKGNGQKAKKGNEVTVHYKGTLKNGKVFDSSYDRNEPIVFDLLTGKMIPGFDEGVSLMSKGDKYRLLIPYKLGYGEQGSGAIPAKADLIFDVELLDVKDFGIPLVDTLWNTYEKFGIDAVAFKYHKLKMNEPKKFDFRVNQLRELGNKFLLYGKFEEASMVFKMNMNQFPESGYVYDSMGECYVMQFKTDEALKYYHMALEKDSTITNSKKMIMLLEKEKNKTN